MVELKYRDIRPGDLTDLTEVASDWSVVRQLGGWPWPPEPEFTKSRCQPYDGDGFVWAICIDDKLYGTIGVTGGDLGYMLNPVVHGKGIATKATEAAVAHAYATQDRDVITGSTWYDNPASARVLGKLGFVHWQTRYVRSKARGFPVLVHHRKLTRETWQRLRSAAQ